jgi:hypothetical protein
LNLTQTVYFMSLVGAIAGLLCWVVTVLMGEYLQLQPEWSWVLNAVNTTAMGALIGGMTVAFADRWSSDRVLPRWVAAGIGLGLIAGLLSGIIAIPIQTGLSGLNVGWSRGVGRIAVWTIAGGLIGLVTGLRWVSVNPLRALHATMGGLMGGLGGGLIYQLAFTVHEVFQALAFVLIGLGIALGVTLAPVLLRDGVLQFISSGDPRAQNKYASPRQEWFIQRGDQYVIGSQGAEMSMTMYARDVQVYIPDALVAPRHALLFERRKRYFIQQHPENVGPQNQPLTPLLLDNMNVVGTRELRDGAEIVVGQTLLRFSLRRKRAAAAAAIANA